MALLVEKLVGLLSHLTQSTPHLAFTTGQTIFAHGHEEIRFLLLAFGAPINKFEFP